MNQIVTQDQNSQLAEVVDWGSMKQNPVAMYIHSLNSVLSREVMLSNLGQVIRIFHNLPKTERVNPYVFPWNQIDKAEVLALVRKMTEMEYSVNTIQTYVSAVRGVLAECFELKLIDAEKFERLKRVKRPSGSDVDRGRSLNKAERDSLINSCDDTANKGIRDRSIFGLLTTCGLRRNELVSLRMTDFDELNSVILIRGKGNKKRKAYLKPKIKHDLLSWLAVRGDSGCHNIFCKISKSGNVITENGLTSQAVYFLLNSYQEKLGLEPFMPHDLRRTVATVLLESGEDLVTVRDVLGHSSVNTTQRYDKRGEHNKKKAMLNSAL